MISKNTQLNTNNILDKVFGKTKINFLVQIGANDGVRFDNLNFFIKKYKIKSVLVDSKNIFVFKIKLQN